METILVVEDDPAQAEAISQFMRAWAYDVVVKPSAAAAITYLSTHTPGMAIIDLHLEDHPGIEILKHIRDLDGPIPMPVFIISAEDSPEIRIVCMSSGADDFLPKPLNMADISMKVQQAFERVSYKKQIHALNEKLEKEKRSLQRYFSDDLVEKILSEEISTELGGTLISASIMFFDIRGSTPLAEKIGPQAYAETISELFADLMDIIFNHRGSVNELLGDGILATFGCPFPGEHDAQNAVQTAIAIETHMTMLNAIRSEKAQVPFGFGIGIATGRIFAGNIGSARMIKYAVMGDPVNTAARLQDLTKDFPYPIIFDEKTRELGAGEVLCEKLPVTQLRGKKESVTIYGLRTLKPVGVDNWSI